MHTHPGKTKCYTWTTKVVGKHDDSVTDENETGHNDIVYRRSNYAATQSAIGLVCSGLDTVTIGSVTLN